MSLSCQMQIGDLKGLFGLLMVSMQMLRAKLKVLDVSYGNGTGRFLEPFAQISPEIVHV